MADDNNKDGKLIRLPSANDNITRISTVLPAILTESKRQEEEAHEQWKNKVVMLAHAERLAEYEDQERKKLVECKNGELADRANILFECRRRRLLQLLGQNESDSCELVTSTGKVVKGGFTGHKGRYEVWGTRSDGCGGLNNLRATELKEVYELLVDWFGELLDG